MRRRLFIARTFLGLGSLWCLPTIANYFSGMGSSGAYQLLPLAAKEGQIRHGLLDLPQISSEAHPLVSDWLLDISRNVFFKNGFVAASDGQDMEIISILLQQPSTRRKDAIQIQHRPSGSVILMEEREYALPHAGNDWVVLEKRENEHLRMVFGHLDASSERVFSLEKEAEIFVFVLQGELMVNDVQLPVHTGLEMTTSKDLHFSVLSDTQLIIIENPKI
ncbi:MAG: hypothetical protein AAF990_05985 [Bacteroidota bacterium]